MAGQKVWLLAPLLIALLYLPACTNRNSAGSSSTLVHGFGDSNHASAQTGEARVIKVRPDVVAIHDGRADKLQVGMMVPTNAILRSDEKGSAELSFKNGTTVNVSPNSEIALSSVVPAVADAQKDEGAVKGLSRRLSDAFGRSGSSSTTQATIGVRGLQ